MATLIAVASNIQYTYVHMYIQYAMAYVHTVMHLYVLLVSVVAYSYYTADVLLLANANDVPSSLSEAASRVFSDF